jgi:hypothetical protein
VVKKENRSFYRFILVTAWAVLPRLIITTMMKMAPCWSCENLNSLELHQQKVVRFVTNKFKVSEEHNGKVCNIPYPHVEGEWNRLPFTRAIEKSKPPNEYKEWTLIRNFNNQYAQFWIEIPLIYMKGGNDSIRKIESTWLSNMRLSFLTTRNYKLSPYLDVVIKRLIPINLKRLYWVGQESKLDGISAKRKNFKIFPIPNDANNKWVSFH